MCWQWWIQDFLEGGANPSISGKNLLFGKIFAENFMKMKERRGAVSPPPRSANGCLPIS